MLKSSTHIGFLATGDELTNGTISDKNACSMAGQLTELGFIVGQHLIVGDDVDRMAQALAYLLSLHDVVITTGGLGPTSDDNTRDAIAKVTKKALQFSEASWDRIIERLTERNLTVHETNRQQAFFPEGSIIFPNPHGSADGCVIEYNHQFIFMLPGPPHECHPMFDAKVLPHIIEHVERTTRFKKIWHLTGLSESEAATIVESIVAPFDCQVSYRWESPNITLSIVSQQETQLDAIVKALDPLLSSYILLP